EEEPIFGVQVAQCDDDRLTSRGMVAQQRHDVIPNSVALVAEESVRLVSEDEFPASREFTGNFIDSGLCDASTAAKKGIGRALPANSLRIRTGNFLRPCREFKLVIRELSDPIREARSLSR